MNELPKSRDNLDRFGDQKPHDSLALEFTDVDLLGLVILAQTGQPEAVLELLRRFAPLICEWQRRLANQRPHEQEDVLYSEVRFVFVLLVVEFDAERGVPFEGYLCHMLAHRLADHSRRECRASILTFSELELIFAEEGEIPEVPDWWRALPVPSVAPHPTPDECWCRLWWQEAITILPLRQQEVITLILEGHSERKVAEIMGIHHTTVHEAKRAAQKKLQKLWQLYPSKIQEKSI